MEKPIRLLVLTHNYPRFDGDFAGVFLSLLNRRLPEHQIEPVILAPHHAGAAEYEEKAGVKIYRFRYASDDEENLAYHGNMHKLVLGSVSGIFQFRNFLNCFSRAAFKIIDSENINAVAGHWLIPAGIVMKTISRKHDLPMILSSHGTDIRLMAKYMGVTYRYFRKLCHELKSWTVVSSFLKNEIERIDPTLESVLTVLPLPHNENIFFRDDSIDRDPNLIVSVTRFTEQKRVSHLIQAFALVAENNELARLSIYGTGPDQAEIESLIDKFGLRDRISIHAPVDQAALREVYNQAGTVVLNSYREGFGLSLSEAQLCGAAVIGTNSGGITDIIENDRTGLLVELDNPAQLADSISRIQRDESLRCSLSESGWRHASNNYASGPLAAKYAEIVRSAFDRHTSTRD